MISLPHGPPPAAGERAAPEAELLQRLRDVSESEAARVEQEVITFWSKSGSASMDFLLKRGRDAIEINDWSKAINHLTAVIDHAPGFAEAYHTRAIAFFRTDRFGPALADLEQALALNPNHFGALRGLATILETLGDTTRANRIYGLVLDLHPHDSQAQEGLERTRDGALGQAL